MNELSQRASRLVARLRDRVVPAALTPMHSDGSLARSELQDYASTLCASGAGGVAVWAHTGRGLHLTPQQRRTVLETFRATTDLPLVVGVGSVQSTETPAGALSSTRRMAHEAVELGADALLVFPPIRPASPVARAEATVELHRALADELDVPLLLFYLHGEAGGFPYSPGLLRELLSMPQTAGVKLATLDSAMTCQDVIAQVREEFPDRLSITGEDRMFGPSLMWGASGSLVGIAAAIPRLTLAVAQAWQAGDAAGFVAASQRLDRFSVVTFRAPMEGYVQRMLWAAEWEGSIPPRAAHDVFGPPLAASNRSAVFTVLDELFPEGPQVMTGRSRLEATGPG